jgi:hypothetical protein
MNPSIKPWVHILLGALMLFSSGLLLEFSIYDPFFHSMIISFGFFYGLTYNGFHSVRLIKTSLLLAFFLSLPFLYIRVFKNTEFDLYSVIFSRVLVSAWLILLPFVFYICHCFHSVIHKRSSFRIKYADLFYTAWNTGIVLLLASLFSMCINGLIFLFLIMLQSSNIQSGLMSWLDSNPFYFIFTRITLLLIGIGIVQTNISLIHRTRFLALRLAYFIYPVVILFTFIVFGIYSYTNLISTETIPTGFLMLYFGIGIIFFNAVFQDGEQEPAYPKWFYYPLKGYLILLAVLAIIIVYKNVHEMADIRNLWLLITLILMYGVGYAVSAFMNEQKASFYIKKLNIYIALYFVIAAILSNSIPYSQKYTMQPKLKNTWNLPTENIYALKPSRAQKLKLLDTFNTNEALLAKQDIAWKNFDPKVDVKAFSDLGICRVSYNDGFEIGSIIENKCVITYAGNIIIRQKFVFLDTQSQKLQWRFFDRIESLPLGIELIPDRMQSIDPVIYLRVLYACKVSINGMHYIGKIIGDYCNVAYQGREKIIKPFRVLSVNPKGKKT